MKTYTIEVAFRGYTSYRVEAPDEGAAGQLATAKFIEEFSKAPAMSLQSKSTECTTVDEGEMK